VDRAKTLAFCREILANGTPAWQRLQAVRCLIAYRAVVLGEPDDLLADIRTKLADLVANESAKKGTRTRFAFRVLDPFPLPVFFVCITQGVALG